MKNNNKITIFYILLLVFCALLGFNEKKLINNLIDTETERSNLTNISNDTVNDLYNDTLVCVNGKLNINGNLNDNDFGVSVKTSKLVRIVEMYQWKEVNNKYKQVWSSELYNISDNEYNNPDTMPYSSTTYYASDVMLGEFRLSFEQIDSLETNKFFNDYDYEKISGLGYTISDNYITNSNDINNPNIGDIRISFKYNDYEDVTVLATQNNNTFDTYITSKGEELNMVVEGIKEGEDLLNLNPLLVWTTRIISIIGIMLSYILSPKYNFKKSILYGILTSILLISIPWLCYFVFFKIL